MNDPILSLIFQDKFCNRKVSFEQQLYLSLDLDQHEYGNVPAYRYIIHFFFRRNKVTVEENIIYGCTDLEASNYNPEATVDTGICVFAGCTDTEAYNFDRLATVDNGACNYSVCPDFNGDGEVQISDLMDFLIQWGNIE